ncbi:MAG: hypothetical protein ACD_2C00210G0011 [uncultured bacterium (gcode 4)]|uniref:Uncharacterized protein n=1 Tax=uncultured bacterium (gcode 4) TaxID=1234023 RepID=K2G1X2_9BACT|nr:MAG: hypothetical protein ACD_2C00210G0011 [uncultured bacterium (gcode 4)]
MTSKKTDEESNQENIEKEIQAEEEKPKGFSMQSVQKPRNPATFKDANTFSKWFKWVSFDSKHRAGRWASRWR